jgi:hypothetical protein
MADGLSIVDSQPLPQQGPPLSIVKSESIPSPEGFWSSFYNASPLPAVVNAIKGGNKPPAGQPPPVAVDPWTGAAQTITDAAKNAYQHIGAAGGKIAQGDYSGALGEYAGAVPFFGQGAQKSGQQAAAGNYAGAAGSALGTISGAAIPEAKRGGGEAAQAVKDFAAKPGAADILMGGGLVAGGATGAVAGALKGHAPIGASGGLAATLYGLGRIKKGLTANKAAAVEAAGEAVTPPPNQFTGPRNPAWKDIPAEPDLTAPDATPIPSPLPSGRTPGGIQNQQPITTPAASSFTPSAADAGVSLNDLAMGQYKKPFGKLKLEEQANVKSWKQRIDQDNQQPTLTAPDAPTPAPTPAPPTPSTPKTPPPRPTSTLTIPPADDLTGPLAHSVNRANIVIAAVRVMNNGGYDSSVIPSMRPEHWAAIAQEVDKLRGAPQGSPPRAAITDPATIDAIKQRLQLQEQLRDSMTPNIGVLRPTPAAQPTMDAQGNPILTSPENP